MEGYVTESEGWEKKENYLSFSLSKLSFSLAPTPKANFFPSPTCVSHDGASVPTQNVPAMHRRINFFLTNILIHLASFSRLRSLMFMFKLLFTN